MALSDELFSDLTYLLESKCGIAPNAVTMETGLFDELGLDSLDLIAIAQVLQAKYQVVMDNESIATVRTVADVIAFVSTRLKEVADAGVHHRDGAIPAR